MLTGNSIALIVGIMMAVILVAVGCVFGQRFSKSPGGNSEELIDPDDHERMPLVSCRAGSRSFVANLIDSDRFKSINHSYGHRADDSVVRQIARVMRIELEQAIVVARLGGEAFAAIMDGPLRIAANTMNEIRRGIASEPMMSDDGQLAVTVSIELIEPGDDLVISSILRRTEESRTAESLDAANSLGRNRVSDHDGRGPTLVGVPKLARKT